ncbi:MAG TPA: TonB-dependent receptor [Rhodanobacteraceae bacterium]|nr:TonB-dependent receptor [Rhodanobacteraceae bacterium]
MHRTLSAGSLLFICLGLAMFTRASHAGEPKDLDSIEHFPASYFAKSAPDTAWDMLLRLPGFRVIEPDEDLRGYQGARGNVWIDNAWPSSKHDTIENLLKRIPASAVREIELIHSGAKGLDLGGFSLIANVQRRHDRPAGGQLEAGLLAGSRGWLVPRGRLEYTLHPAAGTLELGLKLDPELDDDSGSGSIRKDSPSHVGADRHWNTTTHKRHMEATARLSHPLGAGELALSLAARNERERVDSHVSAIEGEAAERDQEAEDTRQFEADLGYRLPVSAVTTLELLTSHHTSNVRDDERSSEGDESETFRSLNRSREDILRAALQHQASNTLAIAAALESAINHLDGSAELATGGISSALPGSDVAVEERRSEASFTATWTPLARVSLEAGLRAERSRIRVSGDARREHGFFYPKPRLALRYDLGPDDRWLLSIEREVGQLDFDDFASSASLASDAVAAGNADLVPDKTWRMSSRWEHRLGDAGSIALGYQHDRIDDVIDRVLIDSGDERFDAPGNIGNGRRDTLQLDLLLPLDALGIVGGRLRSSMKWQRSRVTDPVTGESRPISGEKPVDGEIAFTQDLPEPQVNWGLTLEHLAERKTKYRYDRIQRESEHMGWTVFVERNLGQRWRLRCEATDLFGRRFSDVREKFDGIRGAAPAASIERRNRRSPGTFSVVLRRDFGAGQ